MKFSARDTSKLRKKRAGVWGCCRVYEGGGKGIYGGGYFNFRQRRIIGDIEQQRKEPATQNAFTAAARATAAAARATRTTRAVAAVEDGRVTMDAHEAIAFAIAAASALAREAGINAGIAATLDGADAGEAAMATFRAEASVIGDAACSARDAYARTVNAPAEPIPTTHTGTERASSAARRKYDEQKGHPLLEEDY